MTPPEPILKGIFQDTLTGKTYWGYFLKHSPDAGEDKSEDCFLTIPSQFSGGEHNCGESGIYPVAEFAKTFKFVEFPGQNQKKKFGPQ